MLLVLEEQLRRELDRIEERRRDLAASRDLLSKVTSVALGATEPLSEPISDAIAPSVVNRLLTETTGMLRNFVLTISEGRRSTRARCGPTRSGSGAASSSGRSTRRAPWRRRRASAG